MPGWMGLRGLEPQNPHDRERQRREEQRAGAANEAERRSHEKVREILRDQSGDMSAYTGNIKPEYRNDCEKIAALPVSEIVSARVAVLTFDDTLMTVKGIFERVRFHHLPVVDEAENVIGILSDRDFLRMVSPFFGTVNEQNRDKEIMNRRVGTIMTRNPICIEAKKYIQDAVGLMNAHKISCLPVVGEGSSKLLGIVTWKDIVRAFYPKAFANPRDSNRLLSGVNVTNPQTSESARLRAKASESARLRARPADGGADASMAAPQSRGVAPERSVQRGRSGDTDRIALPHETPRIAATEKLDPRTSAGQAGSELAARQRERMREQLAENRRRPPTAESARLVIEPEDDGT